MGTLGSERWTPPDGPVGVVGRVAPTPEGTPERAPSAVVRLPEAVVVVLATVPVTTPERLPPAPLTRVFTKETTGVRTRAGPGAPSVCAIAWWAVWPTGVTMPVAAVAVTCARPVTAAVEEQVAVVASDVALLAATVVTEARVLARPTVRGDATGVEKGALAGTVGAGFAGAGFSGAPGADPIELAGSVMTWFSRPPMPEPADWVQRWRLRSRAGTSRCRRRRRAGPSGPLASSRNMLRALCSHPLRPHR